MLLKYKGFRLWREKGDVVVVKEKEHRFPGWAEAVHWIDEVKPGDAEAELDTGGDHGRDNQR